MILTPETTPSKRCAFKKGWEVCLWCLGSGRSITILKKLLAGWGYLGDVNWLAESTKQGGRVEAIAAFSFMHGGWEWGVTCAYVYTCAYKNQKSTLSGFLSLPFSPADFFEMDLSLNLQLADLAWLPGQQIQDSFHHPGLYVDTEDTWLLGMKLRSSCCAVRQTLYQCGHFLLLCFLLLYPRAFWCTFNSLVSELSNFFMRACRVVKCLLTTAFIVSHRLDMFCSNFHCILEVFFFFIFFLIPWSLSSCSASTNI